jgi:transposase
LPKYIEEGGEFMHNGASPYRGNLVKNTLTEIRIRVILWPPYSLDFNSIKNLWALIKAKIYKLYPKLEYALNTNNTLDTLIKAAKEA